MTATKGGRAQHTPGPWHVEQYGRARTLICSADGVMDGAILTEIDPTSSPDGEANARLIAAAPELLEVLQRMVADASFMGDGYAKVQTLDIEAAERVIAKVEGGE